VEVSVGFHPQPLAGDYEREEIVGPLEVRVAEEYQSRQTQLRQAIESLEKEVQDLKQKRKETPSHVTLGDLPPE
jgi:hypothetical protein